MKKTKTLLEALLLEHVNVTGADFISTDELHNFDLFRIRTWAAAQEFVCEANATPAGQKWCQNEDTFNDNINEQTKLYFFVNADTAAVVLAAISSTSNHNFTWNGHTYSINYQLEDVQGRHVSPFSTEILEMLPNSNITGIEDTSNNDVNNSDNNSDSENTDNIHYLFLDQSGDVVDDYEENHFESLEDAIRCAAEAKDLFKVIVVNKTTGDHETVWEKPKQPCYIACTNYKGETGLFYIASSENEEPQYDDFPYAPYFIPTPYALRDSSNNIPAYAFVNRHHAQEYIDETEWDWVDDPIDISEIKIIDVDQAKEYAAKFLKRRKGFDNDGSLIDKDTGEILKDATSWQTPDLKIIVKNGEAIVVGCRKKLYNQTIRIPQTYNNCPVTTIASYAFFNIDFYSLEIPSSVKTIQRNAIIWTKGSSKTLKGRIYKYFGTKTYSNSISSIYNVTNLS